MTNTVPRELVLTNTRGMLQKELFVVFTRPSRDKAHLILEMVKPHLEHQVRIEREGKLIAAGPFWTEDGQHHEGEGMFILRADTIEEARRIADSDPMHSSGARAYTIRPWLLNEGSMTFTVRFSDQRVVVG